MAWIDEDGDGFHDETGESRSEYDRRAARRAEEEYADDVRYGRRRGDGSSESTEEPEGGWYHEQPEEMTEEEAAAAREDRRSSYRDSRGGDQYAGEDPSAMEDYELGIDSSYDTDEALEGTFLLGDLGGSNARMAEYRRRRQDAERQGWIDQAAGYLPSADDLWVQYEEEGFIGGPEDSALAGARSSEESRAAQSMALAQLQDVAQGGLTEADRAMMALGRQQVGQQMRAARDADMQALQARGMGGSGAALASMLSAQQGGAMGAATADAQMQIAAQQRALAAMQQSGDLGTQMRGQSFNEEATRGSAIDDFNRWQTDYQRDRERMNTDRRNQTHESRAGSRQQAYENRERMAALRTGQYSNTRDPSEVSDAANERTGGLLGGLFSAIAG